MTDHAQEAAEWIEVAEDLHTAEEGATLLLRAAQVHATLALVQAQEKANEQARIANLITLSQNPNIGFRFAHHLYEMNGKGVVSLRPEIAAALGITEES